MYNKRTSLGIFLILIMISSAFVPTILPNLKTSQMRVESRDSPLIVMFGYSTAEIAARDNFLLNFPNSQVIDFADNARISSFQGPIVFIGHSSENGIAYQGQVLPWLFIQQFIVNSKSLNYFILGCNSETITALTQASGKHVVSFSMEIDALLGVGIISYQIAKLLDVSSNLKAQFFSQIFSRLSILTTNPELALPMMLSQNDLGGSSSSTSTSSSTTTTSTSSLPGRFGGTEVNSLGIIGLALFMILFPVTGVALALDVGAIAAGLLTIAYAVYAFMLVVQKALNGQSFDTVAALAYLWTILLALKSIAEAKIWTKAWWEQGIYLFDLSFDSTKDVALGLAIVAITAVALFAMLYYIYIFMKDWNDYDLVMS